MTPEQQYDVVIVGGGMAGLSTALVLGRARRRVAVIDTGSPRNAPAGHVHGYPTRDGTTPARLLELARTEVRGYGVEVLSGTATGISPEGAVELADSTRLRGRQVVLAAGLKDVLPPIEGIGSRWGRDVLQCPYCHGWEIADRRLAVLGTSESSLHQALLVATFSPDVVLLLDPAIEPDAGQRGSLAAMGVEVVEGRAAGLAVRNDALSAVVLEDGRTVPCDALFCEPAASVDQALVAGLDVDSDGCVRTDGQGHTGKGRIWAVGNVRDPSAQVVAAAGDGYRLAVAVNAALLEEDVSLARSRAAEAGIR